MPTSTPLAARKQWIAGTLRPAGAIHIDAGALRALHSGKSLLPAGVTGTLGRFECGDTVSVLAPDGVEVARGIAPIPTATPRASSAARAARSKRCSVFVAARS